jgi:hypothetical protein
VSDESALEQAEAALAAAIVVENADEAIALGDPTAANKAAVKALADRVEADQAAVTQLEIANEATNLPPNTPSGTGLNTSVVGISPTDLAALIAAEVSGNDFEVAQFIDTSGDDTTTESAWDYFQGIIDDGFSDLESSFEALTSSAATDDTIASVVEIGAGVTADLGTLDATAFAAFLLLGEYGFGWIVKQVAELFPNPSVFGFHPLAFLQDGINGFGNQFETSAKQLGLPIANVMIQPIRQIYGLFQRAFNSTAAAHQKIATVVNTTIPNSTAGIEDKANAYTDSHLAATLAQAEQYSDTLHNELENDIAVAKAEAENAAQSDATAVQDSLVARLQGDESTLSALATEVTTTIPTEIQTEINKSVATENQALTAAITPLQQQLALLQQQMANEQSAIAANNQAIATAQQNIATLNQAQETDEGAIAAQQQIIANAQADIATSTTAISDLETQITGISGTLAPIQATQQLQTQQISTIDIATEVSIPVALAALSTKLSALQTTVDECSVDNCDTANPNNIQNVLRDLLELLTAAAEIGFIAEAIKDPLGTADALAPFLNTIDASAVDTLNLLLEL